jgi:Flp pilus assembly protein TadD
MRCFSGLCVLVALFSCGCKDAAEDWVEKGKRAIEKKDYPTAIRHFGEAITRDAKNEEAFYERGFAYYCTKEYDKAVADYDEAIRLNPRHDWAYNDRGNCYKEKKDFKRAIDDYTAAIKVNDQIPEFYNNRAIAYRKLGEFQRVVEDHQRALKLSPKHPMTLNDMAWFKATCMDETFRDGKKAVEYAKAACELTEWKNPFYLDTLAAANAEAGDFKAAVAEQEKALGFSELAEQYGEQPRARLDLYRQGKPYRESVEAKR